MRFVVFIDLFSTMVAPAAIVYIGYLLYVGITEGTKEVMISFILFGVIYGLQAIIFLLRRKWEHIGYMIISILALPLFSFFIPIYSFWHFDDFSWGNTRLVVGEKGGKKYVSADDEKFDPRVIPRKKWSDYEQELWEVGSQHSHKSSGTAISRSSQGSHRSRGHHPSDYGAFVGTGAPSVMGMEQNYRQSSYSVTKPGMSANDRRTSQALTIDNTMMGGNFGQDMFSGQQGYNNNTYGRPGSVAYSSYAAGVGVAHSVGAPSVIMDFDGNNGGSNGYPTDAQILSEIRRILSTADLMTVTKKQVREELTTFFGVDMMPKKDYINVCIEQILQGKL
jgi:chitin synthase